MSTVKPILLSIFLLLFPSPLRAETSAQAGEKAQHCCTVVRIDQKRGVATARETATGYTFRIEVKNRKQLAALKIGDKVWADFAARRVRLEAAGDTLCCPILEADQKPESPISTANPVTRS